ncbi:Protein of unknown function [Pyronema omphalodes CBS 100304]|uniref:Uncharacterized protein n=1 Tax=Pyronema omphalodes (strain CBS 100304) TaxID=1076935 RepID=U4LU17_PYROM|nr:Protein of unknown function [Pyronema omphalodes CBS 100304]
MSALPQPSAQMLYRMQKLLSRNCRSGILSYSSASSKPKPFLRCSNL